MNTIQASDSPLRVFDWLESEVRSYCRSFPAIFKKAKGYRLWDREGREYIDFFAGAGALNYGHNNPRIKEKLIQYLLDDGICHSLDMATEATERFLERFHEVVLKPRHLNYKLMFPGPTGTNAVESALKLARKVTGRQLVMGFTNAFHGMTIGSLSITGNKFKRKGAGMPLPNSISMPFDGYLGDRLDSIEYIERLLEDNGSGVALPAAIILETVQGEGGIHAASYDWLRRIRQLCDRWNILMIVDDVQAGCGRTGPFFSFEPAGIEPDIICLSKSIGGYGLPLALTLIKPEYDIWEPGEHNGTFRGNNLAFVAAAEALAYWKNDEFSRQIQAKGEKVNQRLHQIVEKYPELHGEVRGRGLLQGIAVRVEGLAEKICAKAFQRGLIMETSGPDNEVIKLLPPLIIDHAGLEAGLEILEDSIDRCVS